MWPGSRKKKELERLTTEAIKAIRKESKAASLSIQRESSSILIDARSAHFGLISRMDSDLKDIVKGLREDIDAILEAHMIRSLDSDVAELGEDVVTDEFPDLDSRAVFANPYAIKDPDFSDHFNLLERPEE